MRMWHVFLMTLALLPLTAMDTRAQEEQAAPGMVETLKEKAQEFFTPPPVDPALAAEPMAQEIADAMHEGVDAEHEGGGLPQFDPTWFASQAFWLLLAFGVMYLAFSRRTLPDISSIIENRKNHIQSDLDQAEDLTSQAESVQGAYEKGLQGARDQATAMVGDMHAAMSQQKNDQTEAFRLRTEHDVRAAEERLLAAKDKALNEISDIVAVVAAQAVEKIIGMPADANQARTIVSRLNDDKKAA